MHAALQHLAKCFHNQRSHTGVAFRHGVRAQQHHGAGLSFAQGLANSYAVRADQIHLQLAYLLRRDAYVTQLSHAGIDGIRNLIARELFFHDRPRAFHRRPRSWIERHCERGFANLTKLLELQVVAVNV